MARHNSTPSDCLPASQQMTVPPVLIAGDLEWFERQESDGSDGFLQVSTFGQCEAEIVVWRQIEPVVACQEERFRLDRQLQLEAQKTEHIGDDRTGHPRPQLVKVLSKP